MRIVLYAVGILLILNGGIWFLQGINILPGSFMTGQIKWAIYGGLCIIGGLAVILAGRRLRRRSAAS